MKGRERWEIEREGRGRGWVGKEEGERGKETVLPAANSHSIITTLTMLTKFTPSTTTAVTGRNADIIIWYNTR